SNRHANFSSRGRVRTRPNTGSVVMQSRYAISLSPQSYEVNGRGGIRTHGGFPHARFRVECLKPDSATLPQNGRKRRTLNVQHPTLNANPVLNWTFSVGLSFLRSRIRLSCR